MPILVSCDECGHKHHAAESSAGKKFHCKGCQAVLTVPGNAKADAKAGIATKKSVAPKKREKAVELDDVEVVEDDYEDDFEDYGEVPVSRRSASRKKSKKKRSSDFNGLGSIWGAMVWAWKLDRVERELYMSVGLVVVALILAVVGNTTMGLAIAVAGFLAGLSMAYTGAFWMWLETFHVNKAMWFLGLLLGPFPAIQQLWALVCVAMHYEDLHRPFKEHVIGSVLAIVMLLMLLFVVASLGPKPVSV